MKKYFIIVLFIGLSTGLFCGSVSAANSENDCDMAVLNDATWKDNYGNIYPYENFLIARSHLLAYCCKQKLISEAEKYCTSDLPTNYPESDYYFDHLIDVGFRSLDVVGIYDGEVVDKVAEERNKFISQKDAPLDATTPIKIKEEYIKNRKSKYSIINSGDPLSVYNTKLEAPGEVTLADKYINLCAAVKRIYEDLGGKDKTRRTKSSTNYYDNCMMVATYRVKQENSLAKLFMAKASIRTLGDSIKSYAIDEFIQNRLMKLFDKMSDISELFTTMVKQLSLTEKCNK